MAGNAIGQRDVGSGGEIDGTAEAALFGEEVKHRMVVGQVCGVKRGERGDLGFDAGFAAGEEPRGNAQQTGRVGAQENAECVMEGVRLDQGAVEIDADGHGRDSGAGSRRFFLWVAQRSFHSLLLILEGGTSWVGFSIAFVCNEFDEGWLLF